MKRPLAVTALIDELKRMPGIGQKTAERLSFFLMRESLDRTNKLANAIRNVKEKIILCSKCHGITESNPCDICLDPKRDPSFVCVVEEPHDVYAMENMGHFKGVYHVLMGVISPLDGIGPTDLTIETLKDLKTLRNALAHNNRITQSDIDTFTTLKDRFYLYFSYKY